MPNHSVIISLSKIGSSGWCQSDRPRAPGPPRPRSTIPSWPV